MEEEIKQKPMLQELAELRDYKESTIKKRKLKIPRRAKIRRGKLKKGWIGIIKIDENGNLSGEKQKLEDSTIRLKDKTYHALDGSEIGLWEGKFPVAIIKTWKKGDIMYSPDGKPYLSLKMMISLCFGAIRQLNDKILIQ